jgi:ribonuclease VapC
VIVDSSAIIAILFDEAEALEFATAIGNADGVLMAAPTLVEAALVAEGRTGEGMRDRLDALLEKAEAEIVPFTAAHAALAREAWRRYGKGRHPAGLNLGDCISYALAKARDEPLLYKGEDFARTDVKAAI